MVQDLNKKLRLWSRQLDANPELTDIEVKIRFLQSVLYDEFEPTQRPPHKTFNDRLDDWMNNVASDVDQQALLRLIPYIFFAGKKEMEAMLISAYRQHCVQWAVKQNNISLLSKTLNRDIEAALKRVWFTGLTDSAPIAAFHHLNNLEGMDWKPDWRGLVHADTSLDRVARYLADHGLTEIVIIEDFVGSGTQLLQCIGMALNLPSKPRILFCPLIICPAGAEAAEEIAARYPWFTFSPVLRLGPGSFLHELQHQSEVPLMATLRELMNRMAPQIRGSDGRNYYGPYGFSRDEQPKLGGLVVLHTNCPDNTIPAVHRTSDGPWAALFPRSSRH